MTFYNMRFLLAWMIFCGTAHVWSAEEDRMGACGSSSGFCFTDLLNVCDEVESISSAPTEKKNLLMFIYDAFKRYRTNLSEEALLSYACDKGYKPHGDKGLVLQIVRWYKNALAILGDIDVLESESDICRHTLWCIIKSENDTVKHIGYYQRVWDGHFTQEDLDAVVTVQALQNTQPFVSFREYVEDLRIDEGESMEL